MPQFAPSPSVQSPVAWALNNLRVAAGADQMGYSYATVYTAGRAGKFLQQVPRTVPNLTALRALLKTDNPVAHVQGFAAAFDGGGGTYVYDSTDTTTADDGGYCIVATDGGRWKLTQQVSINSRQWGTKGDNSADDAPNTRKVVNYAQANTDPATYASATPYLGSTLAQLHSGLFKHATEITVSRSTTIRGEGPAELSTGTRILSTDVNQNIFRATPVAQGMRLAIQDMTLRGAGAGTGDLIKVAVGGCNSQRYSNLFLGTPSNLGLNVCGDDIVVDNVLGDASSGGMFSFGTAAVPATNVTMTNCAAFQVPVNTILLYNVKNVNINNFRGYPSSGANRLARFINGYETLPTLIKNVNINGGTLENYDCMVVADSVINFGIFGTICNNAGDVGAARSFFEWYGTCTGVRIQGVEVDGNFSAKYVYDDSAATSVDANITGNVFKNTGGGALRALRCAKTTGVIKNNRFIGFTAPSVSEKVFTSGNAVSPGVINTGLKYTKTFTVTDALVTDNVEFGVFGGTWVAPTGIEMRAFVSATDTVSVEYRNGTAGAIGVPDHDIWYMVTRG